MNNPSNGRRYDDDDDDDDHKPPSSNEKPSTFDFDSYSGDKGHEARGEGTYGRGDRSYGNSKFDFNSYDNHGSSSYDNHGGSSYDKHGGSSYSEPTYGSSSKNYDKGITAIGSSGEMVGPHGYVQGSRRVEEQSM